jgi:serine/threonine-protein kinase HipA
MTVVKSADVFKKGVLAARLHRNSDGVIFSYDESYLATSGPAVASTLPLTPEPRITPAGAVPPFFAGLLPEGRRLSALRRSVKTSADDELSLLVAAGNDTIGDVQILPSGQVPADAAPPAQLTGNFALVRFSTLELELGIRSGTS